MSERICKHIGLVVYDLLFIISVFCFFGSMNIIVAVISAASTAFFGRLAAKRVAYMEKRGWSV